MTGAPDDGRPALTAALEEKRLDLGPVVDVDAPVPLHRAGPVTRLEQREDLLVPLDPGRPQVALRAHRENPERTGDDQVDQRLQFPIAAGQDDDGAEVGA